ncbi:hypothetical protein FRB90_001390 [Tulasnella sp. 427]|nr:hypothetical protein FRB90_001390 [Tulasnella sp. 427]
MHNQHSSHHGEEDPDELEAQHFAKVIKTFREYETYHLSANNRRRKDFLRVPRKNQELLEQVGWKKRLEEVDEKIAANQAFLNLLVDHPDIFSYEDQDDQDHHSHGHESHGSHGGHSHSGHGGHSHSHGQHDSHGHGRNRRGKGKKKEDKPTDFDMDKVRSSLKQFVRDWSEEGKPERDATYAPMLEALLSHFSDIPQEERLNIRVLVPGTGLGRLAWDVAHLGFASQGNEFSHFMLLSSFFVLNRMNQVNQYTIYPWIHSFSNMKSSASITAPISLPDVCPSDLPQPSDFSLIAGDFTEIYSVTDEDVRSGKITDKVSQEGKWNAVLTSFFIDTAKDIVEYLRIIHQLLAPGGVWINNGPLLYHFENDSAGNFSIEASLDEVKAIAKLIGFEISQEKMIPTTYTRIIDGMLRYEYQSEFWVATKRSNAS